MLWLVQKYCNFLRDIRYFTIMVTIDIDECSMQVDECDHTCNNTLGSYTCSCNDGYLLDRNGLQCNGKYVAIIIHHCFQSINLCPILYKISMNALYNWISVSKSVSISMDHTHVSVMKDMHLSPIIATSAKVS